MKKRLRSIDTFRGMCIVWMIFGHSIGWWTRLEYFHIVHHVIIGIFDGIGAAGFLFISGMSVTLSYRKKLYQVQSTQNYSYSHHRSEYFLRALFLLIIGVIYNFVVALEFQNIIIIWQWFILQTLPISLMLMWPIFNCSKVLKIAIVVAFFVINEILFHLLLPFAYNFLNPFGVAFYFLYNGHQMSGILGFFPFFIIGSITGDIIYKKYVNFQQEEKINTSASKFIINFTLPALLIGIGLIIIGWFLINPGTLIKNELSWLVYAVGVQLILFSSLFSIEKLELVALSKKYRFFYFFSFYSFSIFLLHYPIYFLFPNSLSLLEFFIIIPIIILLIGFGLRIIYNKLGVNFSLKYQISRLATKVAYSIEEYREKGKDKQIESIKSY